MGTGERGKGQRRRQKALKEGKTFDKKNNTFREHEVSYVEKALKADAMLEAPSSFKRFMRAQEEIKKRQMKLEMEKRRENGLDVDDLEGAVEVNDDNVDKNGKNNRGENQAGAVKNNDFENKTKKKEQKKDEDKRKYEGFYDEDFANAREYAGVQDDVEAPPASKTTQKTNDADDKKREEIQEEEEEEEEESESESERNNDDDVSVSNSSFSDDDASEDVREEIRKRNMPDKGDLFGEDTLGEEGKKTKKPKKTKYKSLRERKKEQRAQARLEKEEKEKFLGIVKEVPKFGEVAEAPPQITIKRKGGGGAKVDMNGGVGNRQSKIFAELMSKANSNKKKRKATTSQGPVIGLKKQHDLAVLREDLIAKYREMRNRPSTNGRSASLGAKEPSRVFEQRPRYEQIREDAKSAKKRKKR